MRRGDKDNGFFREFCFTVFKYKPWKGDIEVRTNTELFLLLLVFFLSAVLWAVVVFHFTPSSILLF